MLFILILDSLEKHNVMAICQKNCDLLLTPLMPQCNSFFHNHKIIYYPFIHFKFTTLILNRIVCKITIIVNRGVKICFSSQAYDSVECILWIYLSLKNEIIFVLEIVFIQQSCNTRFPFLLRL